MPTSIVKLCEAGAEFSITNDAGATPLIQFAMRCHQRETSDSDEEDPDFVLEDEHVSYLHQLGLKQDIIDAKDA